LESPTDEPWDTALSEAMALLRGEGLKAAVTRMQTGIDSARGGRARLHWQLAAARLCSQAGRQDLARHLLEGMEHTLRDPRLSQWEPQLLVRVMRLLLRTHEQLADKASRQRRDEIFQRLCHLDVDVVLEQALGASPKRRTTHGQRRLGSTQGTHQRHLQPGYQWRPGGTGAATQAHGPRGFHPARGRAPDRGSQTHLDRQAQLRRGAGQAGAESDADGAEP